MIKWILGIILVLLILGVIIVIASQASTSWKIAETVRTPDERFANLSDYPFEPNYVEIEGYRIHYVDEGPRDGQTILLMHGQPSWSYLYRHMIPPLVEAGYRVIAPDLVGFGKSDKPLKQSDHSYQMHVDVMSAFARDRPSGHNAVCTGLGRSDWAAHGGGRSRSLRTHHGLEYRAPGGERDSRLDWLPNGAVHGLA